MGRAKLGIIAGSGELPRRLIAACRAEGRPFFVLAITDHTDPVTPTGTDHRWTRLGLVGEALGALKSADCAEVVFAGAIRRPSLVSLRPDARGAALIARIGWRALGDDGVLRAVSDVLEAEGFRVVGAHDVLGSLVAPRGLLAGPAPDALAEADIARAVAVLDALDALDVSQAVVVQQGIVLGIEAVEGTDALVARAGTVRREGPGGVLVKLAKRSQDRRFDLPTIGLATVRNAAQAGLRGLAIEADGTLLLDPDGLRAEAARAGLFIIGIDRDAGGSAT